MPVTIINPRALPLSEKQVERLWQATIAARHYGDEAVTVRVVSEAESRELNRRYRHKDAPTNVLTFSDTEGIPGVAAEPAHEVALCLAVTEREAGERTIALPDYVALLLVHAFLHATGLDHEASNAAAQEMVLAEQTILEKNGFSSASL